jgi:hydroxymethylglutaryl-CoA lyase
MSHHDFHAGRSSDLVKLIECPRDAMQGWKEFIPTAFKIDYLQSLLKVGFDTIDFGSFVSPKAIPQMADTKQVIEGLDMSGTSTRLLAIVANARGAEEASVYNKIHYLGFPFSVSETFQLRNTNTTIEQSLITVQRIQEICIATNKQLVVYLSMGFGNPYGDEYSEEVVLKWAERFAGMGIPVISVADTVGLATPEQVERVTKALIIGLPQTEIGVHLHAKPFEWQEKIDAALKAGCRRFDGALKGIGGCPMANDALVGNIDTELLIPFFEQLKLSMNFNKAALAEASVMAGKVFKQSKVHEGGL